MKMIELNELCKIPMDERVYVLTRKYSKEVIIASHNGQQVILQEKLVELQDYDNRSRNLIDIPVGIISRL